MSTVQDSERECKMLTAPFSHSSGNATARDLVELVARRAQAADTLRARAIGDILARTVEDASEDDASGAFSLGSLFKAVSSVGSLIGNIFEG